jgi:hypothetical protein
MITLKLKVSYVNGESGKFMSVTSDMLEIVPSAGGVSRALSAWMLTGAAPTAESLWRPTRSLRRRPAGQR